MACMAKKSGEMMPVGSTGLAGVFICSGVATHTTDVTIQHAPAAAVLSRPTHQTLVEKGAQRKSITSNG